MSDRDAAAIDVEPVAIELQLALRPARHYSSLGYQSPVQIKMASRKVS
jgi:hypothetical protein